MSEIQGKPVYGICECKEKRQVLSVDQVADLIQQMADNNWQVPEGYLPKTTVNGIVEQHTKAEIKLWVGTQAEYDGLTEEEKNNCFAIISDDATLNEINTLLNQYGQSIENINNNISNIFDGTTPVAKATNSILKSDGTYTGFTQDGNGILKVGDEIIPRKKVIATNLNATTTLSEESISISLTIPNIQLETGKHYQLIGLWEIGVFKTKIIYDLYVVTGVATYTSISMNVIAGYTTNDVADFCSVTVLASISGQDTLLDFRSANNVSGDKFTINNTVTINDIYEIIE